MTMCSTASNTKDTEGQYEDFMINGLDRFQECSPCSQGISYKLDIYSCKDFIK